MRRMRPTLHEPVALEAVDEQIDRLRRDHGRAREVGGRQARLADDDRQRAELGAAEPARLLHRSLHRGPEGALRLHEQVAEPALCAPKSLTQPGRLRHGGPPIGRN